MITVQIGPDPVRSGLDAASVPPGADGCLGAGPCSVLGLVERDLPEPGAAPGRGAPFAEVVPNQDGSAVVDAVGDGGRYSDTAST
ncbi:hypothetical protein [Agromyces binzhouensis]|uniref:hypothetical protein n=1 Tax=Agromyces binzhouensis TaxID=1817495 RepID=UPI0036301582